MLQSTRLIKTYHNSFFSIFCWEEYWQTKARKKETHKAGGMCIQHGKDEHAVNLEALAACICGQT